MRVAPEEQNNSEQSSGFATLNPKSYALDNEMKLAVLCKAMVLWEEQNVFRVQQYESVHLNLYPDAY